MDKNEITRIRDAIILKALPEVEFDGWRWDMIERVSADCGYSGAMGRCVFPSGIRDVLDGFADLVDREMLRALAGVNPKDLRIRDRIHACIMARYEWLNPHKEAVRQSIQYWMFPTRKLQAGKIVWRTADVMWRWAGDQSSDYNHYSKRALLSGVLVSTTLAWFNDVDEDLSNTRAFLDRRIENVMQFGRMINKVKPSNGASRTSNTK